MAAATSCLLSEDQFRCPICLDVFTDPVTTSCGHNFCKNCITEHWMVNVPHKCPMCKEVFRVTPQLKINTFIADMVAQFKQEAQQEGNSSSSEEQAPKPKEVICDVCTETRQKAVKSCLVCLASYCKSHLDPHLTVPGLKRHQLIDPVENLEDRTCTNHEKPLELFCKTDQSLVCALCPVLDHKTHDVVPLKEECKGKKVELRKTEAELKRMIQERQQKIQEIQQSVELSKKAAEEETAEGIQVFTALIESFQKSLNELIDNIKERQKITEKQAEDFINELEQEISELNTKMTEVTQLSHSEDHLHILQTFPSVNTAPIMKTWDEISIRPLSYKGTTVKALSELEDKLREDMKTLFQTELRRVQQCAVDVTLDPDTAHCELILSRDKKEVYHGGGKKNFPDNPWRFSLYCNVLGKESFSSGRFYFEVQVKEKTKWTLGVARESIDRRKKIPLNPQSGYWTIWLRNGEYEALDELDVHLSLKSRPQKVGVFVDYEEGLVSFYDVDTAVLMYSFTDCCFTDKLRPFFSPCLRDGHKNSAPLIITPVSHNE